MSVPMYSICYRRWCFFNTRKNVKKIFHRHFVQGGGFRFWRPIAILQMNPVAIVLISFVFPATDQGVSLELSKRAWLFHGVHVKMWRKIKPSNERAHLHLSNIYALNKFIAVDAVLGVIHITCVMCISTGSA